MTRLLLIGQFEHEEGLLGALSECQVRGLHVVDAYSPYPIHGIDDLIGIRRSRLPIVCFLGGLTGLIVGLGFQYWSSAVDWPVNVGGKPFDSLPAFVPVGFEMTVLFAGLITALMLLVRSRLWPGKRGRAFDRITDDRFALAIERGDASLPAAELPTMLAKHGAINIHEEVTS